VNVLADRYRLGESDRLVKQEGFGMDWIRFQSTSGIFDKINGRATYASTEDGQTRVVVRGNRILAEFAFLEDELPKVQECMEEVVRLNKRTSELKLVVVHPSLKRRALIIFTKGATPRRLLEQVNPYPLPGVCEWFRGRPQREGWYLWRRSKTVKVQAKWRAYYVRDNNPTIWGGHDLKWGLLENGREINEWPAGGWWIPSCVRCSEIGERILGALKKEPFSLQKNVDGSWEI